MKVKKSNKTFFTIEKFNETFKVGDTLSGWPTDIPYVITAIGEKRFLAKDTMGRERVCTKDALTGWVKLT